MAEEPHVEHNLLIAHLANIAAASQLPESVVETPELENTMSQHESLPDVHHAEAHTHPTLGDINFTGSVSVGGEAGITGSKTVGGFKITFKKGLLTGFEPV